MIYRPIKKSLCSVRAKNAYDIDINPDDIDVTDNVMVVWAIT